MARKIFEKPSEIIILASTAFLLLVLFILTSFLKSGQTISFFSQAGAPSKPYSEAGDYGPKGIPSENWNTAKKLTKFLVDSKKEPTCVAYFDASEQTFKSIHYYGTYDGVDYFDGEDFEIKTGEGYLIWLKKFPGISLKNLLVNYSEVTQQSYHLVKGWQLISIPEGVLKNFNSFKASDLCQQVDSQGGKIKKMVLTRNAPAPEKEPKYNYYFCEESNDQNDFLILAGDTMFLQADSESNFTLP